MNGQSFNYALLSIVGFVCAGAQFVPCQFTELARCQAAFNDMTGIPAASDWKDPWALRRSVESLYKKQAATGMMTICRATSALKKCFARGAMGYDACVNVIGLLMDANLTSTYVTPQQANEYVKLYAQLDFACGAGASPFLNGAACIAHVSIVDQQMLDLCLTYFNNTVAQDPKQVCTYAKIATGCYSGPFSRCSSDAVWWACEYQRTGIAVQYPQCVDNFCRVYSQKALEENADS